MRICVYRIVHLHKLNSNLCNSFKQEHHFAESQTSVLKEQRKLTKYDLTLSAKTTEERLCEHCVMF